MATLTDRETQILTLAATGKLSREIAQDVGIAKRTVDFHFANIYHKLAVTNRVQALREARAQKLIDAEA